MHNEEGRQQCFKVKTSIMMMIGGHGGMACMACMAQEYQGDGDVNGMFRKINNVNITNR
jgi:hypothetical protein